MLPHAPGQASIRTCAVVTLVRQSNLSAIANAVPRCLRFFRSSYGPTLAVLLALLILFVPSALAGPHDGGTLILHADPGAAYSAGEAYCGVELTACSLAVVQVPADPNTTTVFHALAAFPEAAQVDLRGVTFGIVYDAQRLVLVAHGSCADFVLPTPDWPASGGGVGMVWDEAQTDRLVDLYWFAGYAYSSSESTLFELTPHPVQGGAFVDGTVPAVVDTVAAYGALGFGMPGLLACPEVEEDGGGETDGQDDHDYPVGENEALLVWALETDVEQERVRVKVNRFADPEYQKPFPLESVPIRRVFVYSNPEGRPRGTYADNLTNMVQVAPDGTVADTILHFSDKGMQSALLAPMGAEERAAFTSMAIDPDAVFDVSLPIHSGPTLVSMIEKTVVLNRLGLPPVAHPFNMLLNYPRHSPHVAGIVGFGNRMVVLDEVGAIIRDLKEQRMSYSDHYLCPAGRFLTYVAATRETREVRVLDIETGIEKRVDLPTGPRYYSADGRHALARTRGVSPVRAAYYDVSDPFTPRLLGEHVSEFGIETAAVCDDGSFVALLEFTAEELYSVILYDRALEPLGEPLLRSFLVRRGLQFLSKFLFVGFQDHPRPAYYSHMSSDDILLFDLEPGKEGE